MRWQGRSGMPTEDGPAQARQLRRLLRPLLRLLLRLLRQLPDTRFLEFLRLWLLDHVHFMRRLQLDFFLLLRQADFLPLRFLAPPV